MQRGRTSDESIPLWRRGLVEHPLPAGWLESEQPAGGGWLDGKSPEEQVATGDVYTDGSGQGPAGCRAYGWGFAVVGPSGELIFGAYGTVPGVRGDLSVLRAELYAVLQVLIQAQPPLRIGIDNATVIRGLQRGQRWCCHSRRAHCDLWEQIWRKIEDLGGMGADGVSAIKVKAHRTQTERNQLQGDELRHFLGNELADRAARTGAEPALAPSWLAQLWEQRWKDVQDVCTFVGGFRQNSRSLQ